MLKSGWVRLWVVASIVWLVAVGAAAAYYVWGRDVCYTFVGVEIADDGAPEDKTQAESIKKELTTKVSCARADDTPLVVLEDLGKRGVVTGISFRWLGPEGLSRWGHIRFGDQIKAAEIIHSVSDDVHRARLWNLLDPLVAALILPPMA